MSNKDSMNSVYLERCKCCLDDNGLQSMWEQNYVDGEREVFGELLIECFAVTWNLDDAELICEGCITRLRDAVKFRKEFLAVQEYLQEAVEKSEIKSENCEEWSMEEILEQSMEEEVSIEEKPESFTEIEYLEAMDPKDDTIEEPPSPKKKKKRSKRLKPYRQYSVQDMELAKQEVRGGMSVTAAALKYGIPRKTLGAKMVVVENPEKDEEKDASLEKHAKFIEEIKVLLLHTNVTPFKTKTQKYYCAYCPPTADFYVDDKELRDHTRTCHIEERLTQVDVFMRPMWMCEVIKLDIERLECTTCSLPISDWNALFVHFAETHDIEFNEIYTRAIPYILKTDLQCVLCALECLNFGQLDGHMNAHYCNYICYECGDPFLSSTRLEQHLKVHKVRKYKCGFCSKVFSLKQYRTKHINFVHNRENTLKCLYCSEKFHATFQRHLHMTECHADKIRVLTCEFCGMCFTWKPYFFTHMRTKHGEAMKHECKHCGKTFLMNYELRNHMVKHVKEKNYVCGLCGEDFKQVLDLKEHWQKHEQFNSII